MQSRVKCRHVYIHRDCATVGGVGEGGIFTHVHITPVIEYWCYAMSPVLLC